MLVPLTWLREFTPYEGSAQALGERLTMLGLELDGIVNPFQGLKDIVVGFVAWLAPHPDSDHMHCCKVDIGQGELLDIVCGAPNVAEGQKVAVAPVGARLPDGTVIKKAKLRGQPSLGMICSERELGLSEDHGGILVLPEGLDVGHTLIDALGLDTEVLDLSITPNRSDCLSILGVAREIAAACGLPLHVPEIPLILDQKAAAVEIPVSIENPDLCWLYSGRVVSDAKVGPAPLKMRCRLQAVGVRPVSNLVDVTNYVMMECGQPLHAFDMDKLAGSQIIVRTARAGEKLTTLDGRERILAASDLCICDKDKPVALAGVMGGENSEITASTQNIFIESAVFNPASIRRAARRLGLQSDASYRFERGVDQRRSIWALDRAAALMASICGGFARKGFSLAEPRPFIPVKTAYSPEAASHLLGVDIKPEMQESILSALGCAVENGQEAAWIVVQPSWRPDLTREADYIEEVGRVYGLDKIPLVLPPVRRNINDNLFPHGEYAFWRLIKDWGAGLGLHEVINYSFVGQKDLDLLAVPKEDRLAIFNPLSEEQNVLRTTLAPGLLQDLANNLAYGASGVRLFEVANAFRRDADQETGTVETGLLGVVVAGARHHTPWPKRDEDFDYADIKGILENLRAFLHLPRPLLKAQADHPWLAPCARISFGDSQAGFMGRVKPQIATVYNSQKAVWMLELDLALLERLHRRALVRFEPLPVYPAVKRDITVKASRQLRVDEIMEKIELMRLPLLEGAALVDSYEQPGGSDRSLTFRLTFRNSQRTLKDIEVDKERNKIADHLKRELGVEI